MTDQKKIEKKRICFARVAVTVAEHTSICTVYDFTTHPVSVHLPLTRLLATLFIFLDEPVEVSIGVTLLDFSLFCIPVSCNPL